MPSGPTAAQSGRAAGGGWLFRQRSWLPVPIALVLLLVRWGMTRHPALPIVGSAAGGGGRGPPVVGSWTDRRDLANDERRASGPLITSGPFALCRNPLYVGNLLLWAGFTVWSGLLWMLPITLGVFIRLLPQHHRLGRGASHRALWRSLHALRADTPRWWPRVDRLPAAFCGKSPMHAWRDVAFSERGTLAAIVVGAVLLVIRQLVG